jgi:hypothetical protein
MDSINSFFTSLFDAILTPLEWGGEIFALIFVSGVFGVLALWIFKYISWQKGIGFVKDRIKGHMIAIRIYQDDLAIVGKSVGAVLLRNFQYVGLNFGPFIPLAIPFVFVVAQTVVRYGFDPIPVVAEEGLAGAGNELRVEFKASQRAACAGLEVVMPEGLEATSPLVRVPSQGLAFQEFVARAPGSYEIELRFPDGRVETKAVVAGDDPDRVMQPERVASFFSAALWPAEPRFAGDSPLERVAFIYPDRDLGWLPGGIGGVLIIFIVASMLFGFLALKPLGVKI